ncbi:MAG: hypothetical protein B7W95_01250, partial [Acidimicrobiales bacterium 20-64-4]
MAVKDEGEDSHTAATDRHGGLLCVADGCGGSGARRGESESTPVEAQMLKLLRGFRESDAYALRQRA